MAKYELKTKLNDSSVEEFINNVEPEQKRLDAFEIIDLLSEVTGEQPKMWGTSIVGFGQYHYKYASGQEGDFMAVGFSPRKTKHSLYIMSGFSNYEDLLSKLGKHKIGKSCLYVNKLADIDKEVLKVIVRESVDYITNKTWP